MQDKLVPLTGLWENTSIGWHALFLRRVGKARALLSENKDKQSDKDPDWISTLLPGSRNPKPKATASLIRAGGISWAT